MLLDRGATIPMPHDVKCSCQECLNSTADDSLRFSLSRINAKSVAREIFRNILENISATCHDKSSRAFAESIQTTTNPP